MQNGEEKQRHTLNDTQNSKIPVTGIAEKIGEEYDEGDDFIKNRGMNLSELERLILTAPLVVLLVFKANDLLY